MKWYEDTHLWTKIITDAIMVIGALKGILPPQYAAAAITVTQILFAVDQIIQGQQPQGVTK